MVIEGNRVVEETEGSREDRGLKRGHRAFEGDRRLERRQRPIERTLGRRGTEDCREGRGS
jgi:hypothetical protein